MYSPVMAGVCSSSSNKETVNSILIRESGKRKAACFTHSVCAPPKKRFKNREFGAQISDRSSRQTLAVSHLGVSSNRQTETGGTKRAQDTDSFESVQEIGFPNKRFRNNSLQSKDIYPKMDFSLKLNCTTIDSHYLSQQVSPAMQSPEFSSFTYFQQMIPDLDLEINQFLQENANKSATTVAISKPESEDPSFNSFNYWREPIPDIDFDML